VDFNDLRILVKCLWKINSLGIGCMRSNALESLWAVTA
jgi:hypothetical protein